MDFFGIGAGVRAAISIYLQSARQTGRTTSLFESVKTGDRVIFLTHAEAKRFLMRCQSEGKEVSCVSVGLDSPDEIFRFGTSQGRTIFDHRFVEEFYKTVIERAEKTLSHLETQSSGYGEAHRETKRKAQELARWRP